MPANTGKTTQGTAPRRIPVKADSEPLRRDGVLALLAVLVAVLAPHLPRLPLWLTACVAVFFAWRAWCAWSGAKLPRRWLLIPLTVLGTAGVVLAYGPRFGRDASVSMLAFMLALKVLELATLRDATVVICLGFFLIVTGFLYSQSIPTALYMLVIMVVLLAILIAFQDRNRTMPPLRAARSAGTLMLQAAPLMLVLFVLFPRVQGPLFGFPQAVSTGVSGLSDTMAPGSLSNLGLSDEVAFRVQFHSPMPPLQTLYWRGPVLWDFDGRTWSMGDSARGATARATPVDNGPPISYTVTLEPHQLRWVFAIDLPDRAPAETFLTSDYQLLALRPVRNRMRYDASSHLAYQYGRAEASESLLRALRLPRGYNPRTLELARQIRERSSTDLDVIRNVLQVFHTQLFFYTLVPPELGRDSMDEFLFDTRRGFCEHYAAAFVVLMRAAGIPARVVTGYQGGEKNPLGDYLIVRQSEAHAWAEVWLQNAGWIRVDPTAAVSPARIQVGISAAVPVSDPLPISVRGSFAVLNQLRYTFDAVANSWNQWVLGYTPDRQMKLLKDAGVGAATWQTLVVILLAVTGVVAGVLSLLILRKLKLKSKDTVTLAWREFCRKLARRGTHKRPGEGPQDFARRAATEQPTLQQSIQAIAELYIDLRYANGGGAQEARRLRALVRAL